MKCYNIAETQEILANKNDEEHMKTENNSESKFKII